MLNRSALLSISCGIQQKYILQVIEIAQNYGKIKLFLSDGNAFMCAEVDHTQLIRQIAKYTLVRVQVKYISKQKPLIIKSLEIIQSNYKFVFGSPIPFIDFIKNGCSNQLEDQKSETTKKIKVKFTKSPNQKLKSPQNLVFKEQQSKKVLQVEQLQQLLDQQPQQDERTSKFPILKSPEDEQYVLISDLYAKLKNWKILARISWIDSKICINKSGVKQGTKMLVYNFFIMDKNKNEIKCSCFDEASTKFKDLLKKDKICQFSNGTLIEQHGSNQNSNPQNNRNYLSIRFQTYSSIIQKENTTIAIPLNSYKLVNFSKLIEYDKQCDVDIGGIVKAILKKQEIPNSTKKRLTFILASPPQKKQLEVVIYIETEEIQSIVLNKLLILKNVKVFNRQDPSFIIIKSHYNTNLITKFQENEEDIKHLLPFVDKNLDDIEFESLSEINYYYRNFSQLVEALDFAEPQQRLYSKINCYFLGPFGQKKYIYEACFKCNKKVGYLNRSNYCQKCRKIVDTKQQYVLKVTFGDYSRQIKLTLVGDYAKYFIKKEASDFAKLGIEEQTNQLNSLKFKQVCLYLKSIKLNENINHNVQQIHEPHKQNFAKIKKILEQEIKLEQIN